MDKYDGRVCMSSELMSRIEAMFEAELERLGLNRSTSTLERRLTDLDELPNSVHQVSEDYIWESSILYRPMFTSEEMFTSDEVEILSLNQFWLAIRHAHNLRSETMLLLHHHSFDISLSFGSRNISNENLPGGSKWSQNTRPRRFRDECTSWEQQTAAVRFAAPDQGGRGFSGSCSCSIKAS